MLLTNVLFLHLAFLQTVFSSINDNQQYSVMSTTSKPYEKSNRLNLEIDFDKFIAAKLETLLQNQFKQQNEVTNEMNNQIGELKKEILFLKDNCDSQNKSLSENNIQTQLQKLEQKQEEHLTVLKEQKDQFAMYRNQLQKLEEKQEQLIDDSENTKTFMENVNNNLENLKPPKNCKDLQSRGKTLSGVYTIWPIDAPKSFDVWCDLKTRGGGWTYVINRFDGSLNFNLSWTDYKNGFGDLNGEHWLGLEHLHILTKNKSNELLIELVDRNLTRAYAYYEQFSIENEDEGYPIKIIKGYSGDAGDDFGHHLGWKFSTSDHGDGLGNTYCARDFGGFWFHQCHFCLFTGTYNSSYTGIQCRSFRGYKGNLKEVRMMIRS